MIFLIYRGRWSAGAIPTKLIAFGNNVVYVLILSLREYNVVYVLILSLREYNVIYVLILSLRGRGGWFTLFFVKLDFEIAVDH